MALFATIAAILNMVAAVVPLGIPFRAAAIIVNVVFVVAGSAVDDLLIWAPHLALMPLNAALLIGRLDRGPT